MALYRFLFAPVLLAVAVLTTSPAPRSRAPHPAPPPEVVETAAVLGPAHAPGGGVRVAASHPGSVR